MIKIGSCSWTEKTLLQSKEFYPKNITTAEGRLRYYSSKFNTVEVDSTYYAIPHPRTAFLWSQRTPDDFSFHIKVYGALTGHGTDVRAIPKDLIKLFNEKELEKKHIYIKEPSLINILANRFIDSLNPLMNAYKLCLHVYDTPLSLH